MSKLLRQALLAVCTVAIFSVGCSESPSTAPSSNAENSNTDGFVKKGAEDAMKEFEKSPSFPPAPRRQATFSDKFKNETVFSVGVKTGLLGSEVGAQTKVKFALNFESSLVLARSVKEESEAIVINDAEGRTTLNYVEGVPFVGMCSFQASAAGSVGLVGTLTIFGNGVTTTAEIEKGLSVSETSAFFAIGPDDNLTELRERCLHSFRDNVKKSVMEDLKRLIANNAQLSGDGQQKSAEAKAVLAALKGPELKGVGVYGHEWNVKPAQIEKSGDLLRVSGQLSRRKPNVADNQIYYKIELTKGQVTSAVYDGATGDSDWEQAARKLSDLIASEAFIETGDE